MLRVCIAALVAAIALTTAASAAKDPPLPQAARHRTVTVVARGVPTPTEFAVLAGRLFAAGYGDDVVIDTLNLSDSASIAQLKDDVNSLYTSYKDALPDPSVLNDINPDTDYLKQGAY
jgi:hypothetical protein